MIYKTLNNHLAKFIIETAVLGNPKFTFIRLYNAMKDRDFEFDVLLRLFDLVKRILIETHKIDDIIQAISECPVVVRYWLADYKQTLEKMKGGVIYDE